MHTKEQKAERLPSDNDDAEDDDDDDEPSQAMMAHHPHKTALGCVLDDGGWADKRGKLNESEKRFDRLSTRFIARRIDTIIGRRRGAHPVCDGDDFHAMPFLCFPKAIGVANRPKMGFSFG